MASPSQTELYLIAKVKQSIMVVLVIKSASSLLLSKYSTLLPKYPLRRAQNVYMIQIKVLKKYFLIYLLPHPSM